MVQFRQPVKCLIIHCSEFISGDLCLFNKEGELRNESIPQRIQGRVQFTRGTGGTSSSLGEEGSSAQQHSEKEENTFKKCLKL